MKFFDWLEERVDDTKYEDTYYYIYRKKERIKDSYRSFKRFFKNVYLWFPVLKEDEQWDYDYLEFILLHKLKLMEKFYKSDKVNIVEEDVKRILSTLTPAREALERLNKDDYIHFPEDMSPKFLSEEEEDGMYSMKVVYHPNFGKKKVLEVYYKADEDEKKDRDFVYNTIREHIVEWWD